MKNNKNILTKNKIETEYKLELNSREFKVSQKLLEKLNFSLIGKYKIKDYFFEIKKFDDKKYNFTRIRVYDESKYEKTKKIWILDKKNNPIRKEDEKRSSLKELSSYLEKEVVPLILKKERTDYGQKRILGYASILSLDKVFLGSKNRYFVECEIKAPKNKSSQIRPIIKNWLLKNLNLSDRPEGIGMFRLALPLKNNK